MRIARRTFLGVLGASICGALMFGRRGVIPALAAADVLEGTVTKEYTVEEWMNEWMTVSKAPIGTLHVSRFVEPIYFLTKPIAWKPNADQAEFEAVHVPSGFVTDFASIPRIFWSVLRPDGEYTYPAIVHDYLYWTQTRPRDVADKILKFGMEDFRVSAPTIRIIYEAVRIGGDAAWNGNAKLKSQGEKRILKRFPDDPTARWGDWKTLPDVFAP